MKKLLFFSIGLLALLYVSAQEKQQTQLTGKVVDKNTGKPIAGAYITLSESKAATTSDSSGNYLLKNIPLGHTIVEVSYWGYKTLVEHLDLTGQNQHDFILTTSIIVNEGVTVTAVAGASNIRQAPISISRVNKQELLHNPSSNIIDALAKQPGISQLSTGPAISKPVIRGLGYNRLVVINDGIRQEGQQWGDEHGIEIDENSVSRVEIVKGPASLIYGSDAMAGVINIITTTPQPYNTMRGSILSGYQTNNKQRSFFGSLGGNTNGFNWNLWGDYKAAADYKNKWDGHVFNSRFNEKNFGGYAGYNGSWGFTHFIVSSFNQKLGVVEGERDEEGRFIKPLAGGIEAIPTEDDFRTIDPHIPYQDVHHLKFITDNSFRILGGRISLNAGWQRNRRLEFGNVDDPSERSLFFDLRTFNYNTAYHINDKNGWTTSIGINGMAQTNANRGLEVLIPEYSLFDIGGFIYSRKSIGRSTFSGGVRFDNRSLHTKGLEEAGETRFLDFKRTFSNVSGSVGVSYAASETFLVKFNVARGFRAPGVPELASNGTHEGTNRYEYGNQNLESETSFQADLGIELNSEHILFTANAFYNRINNFIYYGKLSGANGADSLVDIDGELIPAFQFGQRNAALYGGEVLVDIHPHPLDWLHWENSLSYVRGRFESPLENTRNVPLIPAPRWISELRGEFLKEGKAIKNLAVHFEMEHTFDQNKPFIAYQTETNTPGYTLFNASVSTDIVNKNKTLFSVYLVGSNLTDVAYQSHLSRLKYAVVNPVTGRQGVFNMGRNFMFRINIPLNF